MSPRMLGDLFLDRAVVPQRLAEHEGQFRAVIASQAASIWLAFLDATIRRRARGYLD
jgi:hypothetical protein